MTRSTPRKETGRRGEDRDPIDLDVGTKVKALRTMKGLARSHLAARTRTTDERLRKGEAGSPGAFGSQELYKLSRVLEVGINAFFPPPPAKAGILDPLDTPEGRALYAWFTKIRDKGIRSDLAAFAKTLAEVYPADPD